MRGSSHLIIGTACGVAISQVGDFTSNETIAIVATSAIAGLVPDLDTNGKLRNKLTFYRTLIYSLFTLVGLAIMGYAFWKGVGYQQWIGGTLGFSLLILPRIVLTPKVLLFVTGVAFIIAGFTIEEWWLLGFGLYTAIASQLSHRGLTHSVLGLVAFGWIVFELEKSLGLQGVMLSGVIGYLSHLIADMRLFNKKGVRLFQPFNKKEL
ncbi:metal-dependent hydrolase [Desertibacillus haloalkaliphilus]|uniref:metal-dependent hydrolase n=1 Tax=Desertibacillus haloalkaliphilus TaxID=1328930 RepID=UPI001C25C265|nr:metal-dependent hydrolase [Desertibacillus haloalkaliphilus]MBU8908122.1 metal-dependent hydrolase [Desertibacillus haloalkaliphilus]